MRGKRLGTRAVILSLVSGVIVGVTGAAGENATTQRVSVESSAFVRPTTTPAMSVTARVGKTHGVSDGVSQPTVLATVPVTPRHDFVPPVPVGNGNGNGHDKGYGNGNGHDNGHGQGNGDTGSTGSTPATVPSPQSGPTGDPGQNGSTGDQGQNGSPGDQGQHGPTGDPGKGDHGRHRGDGHGNSGQTNPPTPIPTSNPVTITPPTPTSDGPVAHTPVTSTQVAITPAPVSTPTVSIPTPSSKPSTTTGGNAFKVSGLAPVSAKKGSHRSSNPLLSAANSGLSIPLRRVAADLARAAGASGLATSGAGATGSASASAASSASQSASAAARDAAARKAAAAKKAAQTQTSFIPKSLSTTMTQIVRFIPSSIWIALIASLGLAAMGAIAAVLAGRRARRHAHRVAEVSAVALTDPLTGVLNRRGFIEAAERELDRAERHGRPFALSYIDVRGLKRVNDGEGHLAGDQLLKAAAAALTDSVRAHDVVGRLGGDEFGLLLAEQTSEEAAQVCERIADQVTATRAELGFVAHWDLTVGTASFPQDGATIEELLAVADRRLYEQRGIELAAAR